MARQVMWLPFEYQSPILSGIQINTVVLKFILIFTVNYSLIQP